MSKKLLALFLVVLMSIDSLAAVVSDNDGSAFITKAEFDSLKNNFQSQIDNYNVNIDAKIDSAIAAYISGLTIEAQAEQENLITKTSNNFFTVNVGKETKAVATFDLRGESAWVKFAPGQVVYYRMRRMMEDSTKQNMSYDETGSFYGGDKGKYYFVSDSSYGYEPKAFWSNFIVNHYFAGAQSYGGGGEYPNGNTRWTNIVVFGGWDEYKTENVTWGPYIPNTNGGQEGNFSNTVHLAVVDRSYDEEKLQWGFCNTASTTNRLVITETNKNKLEHYAYGKVNTGNSTWGWVLNAYGSGAGYVQLPSTNTCKYDLRKPKTVTSKDSQFISQDLSKILGIPVYLTGGIPIVKCSTEGTLSFKLKFTSTKSGLTAKFGFRANTPFDNSNTIQNYVSTCNLKTADFTYNFSTAPELNVTMEVKKGDIIYLKMDSSGLSPSGSTTYKITPTIKDIYVTPHN